MKYLCDPHVIPTVIPRDHADIEAYARAVSAYCNALHIDIDDGQFVGATSWPYLSSVQDAEIETLDAGIDLPAGFIFEAHLMVSDPVGIGVRLVRGGVKRLSIHRESFTSDIAARDAVAALRAAGAEEVGFALKIETPLAMIDHLAADADFIHLMSIATIGSQGQTFDERALSRVEESRARFPDLLVAVDGGVTEATVEELVRAGANRLMVGHALAGSTDPARVYMRIMERAIRGCAPRQAERTL